MNAQGNNDEKWLEMMMNKPKEELVKMIREMIEENRKITFEKSSRQMIKYLCDNHNPHVTVIITPTGAELLEGLKSTGVIKDYLKD